MHNMAARLHMLDYKTDGPCFQVRRMDESVRLNRIGKLILFLHLLGLHSSAQHVLDGSAGFPTLKILKDEL